MLDGRLNALAWSVYRMVGREQRAQQQCSIAGIWPALLSPCYLRLFWVKVLARPLINHIC